MVHICTREKPHTGFILLNSNKRVFHSQTTKAGSRNKTAHCTKPPWETHHTKHHHHLMMKQTTQNSHNLMKQTTQNIESGETNHTKQWWNKSHQTQSGETNHTKHSLVKQVTPNTVWWNKSHKTQSGETNHTKHSLVKQTTQNTVQVHYELHIHFQTSTLWVVHALSDKYSMNCTYTFRQVHYELYIYFQASRECYSVLKLKYTVKQAEIAKIP